MNFKRSWIRMLVSEYEQIQIQSEYESFPKDVAKACTGAPICRRCTEYFTLVFFFFVIQLGMYLIPPLTFSPPQYISTDNKKWGQAKHEAGEGGGGGADPEETPCLLVLQQERAADRAIRAACACASGAVFGEDCALADRCAPHITGIHTQTRTAQPWVR